MPSSRARHRTAEPASSSHETQIDPSIAVHTKQRAARRDEDTESIGSKNAALRRLFIPGPVVHQRSRTHDHRAFEYSEVDGVGDDDDPAGSGVMQDRLTVLYTSSALCGRMSFAPDDLK